MSRFSFPTSYPKLPRWVQVLSGATVCTVLLTACSPALEYKTLASAQSTSKPVTVSYRPGDRAGVTSLDLQVEVTTRDLRRPSLKPIIKQYRTYQKIISGVLCLRTDFVAGFGELAKNQSVVTDGKTTLLFDPQNEGKAERVLVDPNAPKSQVPPGASLSKRIPNLASTLQRLSLRSFQLKESGDHKTQTAQWTGRSAVDSQKTLVRRTLQFDVTASVLQSEENVVVDEVGTQTVTTVTYLYTDSPAGPVVAEKRTTTKVDYADALDVSDRTLPRVESLESIPTVTPEELQSMVNQGALVYPTEPLLGDPADPDTVTETIETNTQITINQTDDSLFRLVL